MPGKSIKIRAREDREFDCYLNVPDTDHPVPAVVLASAVHGVDADIIAVADEFAARRHRRGAGPVLAHACGAALAR
jgi:carboxymethylenebutenolidase